jgi:hypothetical protein
MEHIFNDDLKNSNAQAYSKVSVDITLAGIGSEVRNPTMRQLLQEVGMWGRRFYPCFWLDGMPEKEAIIPDVRFDNEAEYITKRNGIVVEVVRPGIEAMAHASEKGVNKRFIAFTIHNDGDFDALLKQVNDVFLFLTKG